MSYMNCRRQPQPSVRRKSCLLPPSMALGIIVALLALTARVLDPAVACLPAGSWNEMSNVAPRDDHSIWPQFRGPRGDGIARETRDLPIDLESPQALVWQAEVPGSGWSSPVLDGQRLWLTAAVPAELAVPVPVTTPTDSLPSQRKGLDLVLLAFDRRTGELLETIKLFHLNNPEQIHSLNSYASPTPCMDQENIYCHFGTYGTAAVRRSDATVLWRSQAIEVEHVMGPGSSPILYENRVIFHADGVDTQSIVALNSGTGDVAWRTQRSGKMSPSPDQQKAYCTPQVTIQDGQALLVSPAANWLYVYDPTDGRERYRVSYGQLGYSTVPRPIISGSLVYFCTGFDRSRMMCVDLSPSHSGAPDERVRWTADQRMPTMPSPVLIDDLIYAVSDAGIATCLDRETGEVVWTERLRGKFASSPLYADGKIYIGNQNGTMYVLQPGRELTVLASNQLDGSIMASPIAVGGELYIRTEKSLYRFGNKP